MDTHLSALMVVATVSLLAAISPGPDFAIVVRNSLVYSRQAGYWTAVGIALGLIIHLTYTLVGIALLIAESPLVFNIIKYAGATYLCYLGVMGIRAAIKNHSHIKVEFHKAKKDIAPLTALKQGFLTNALNPKCAVFFISLFSQFITPETTALLKVEYGVVNLIVTLLWFLFLSYLITGHYLTSRLDSFRTYIDGVMGAVLVALSLKLLLF